MNSFAQHYQQEVRPRLMRELGLKNIHQVPRLEKVVLNIGIGRGRENTRLRETAENTLRKISGQAPVATKARASIAAFKLREGETVGLMVTLRGERMYEFLERLIKVVLPRTRDFRGLARSSFDGAGNYHIGLRDQSVFPELTYEETTLTHGLQINIVTNSRDRALNEKFLEAMGLPLVRTAEAAATKKGQEA